MIKRFVLMLALAVLAVSAASAEVKIKDLGDGKVEIVFTYKDDAATEMGVIGSFDNWTVPGEPMTRNADGLWEYTLKATTADEIVYKFYSKGTWIFDFKAPDKKDDGFGGNNGLIVVADVLAAQAVGGSGAPGAVTLADPYAAKLNFGMYTILGSKTTFLTQGIVDKTQKGLETDTTGLFGKAYWKVGGTLLPNVTGWFEMKAFEGYRAVWAQDARGIVSPELGDGLAGLASGLLYNPVNWIGGANPVLNSVKFGLDTPAVVWETGYGYAKPQLRTAVIWQTLDERDGNDGYMRFDLGSAYRKLGDLAIEATVAPNKITGNYGFFGWFGASSGDLKLDFQYDFKSAAATDLSTIFDKLYHQDFILGAKYKLAGVNLAAQGLVNLFSETPFAPESHLAGEFKADWALPADAFGLAGGYRYTGSLAAMIFGETDSGEGDGLGEKGSQRVYLNLFGKPAGGLRLGLDASATLDHTEMPVLDLQLYGKPYVEYDLSGFLGKKSSINAYAKAKYLIHEGFVFTAGGSSFLLGEAGAKFYLDAPVPGVVNSLDAYLGFNNWSEDDDKTLTTLVLSARMPKDLGAELGLGLRAPRATASAAEVEANNWFGFSIGANWKVPVPAIKTPQLYGAFVYNMDPYDDGTANLDMADYVTDGGVSKSDGYATLRLMMKWDF